MWLAKSSHRGLPDPATFCNITAEAPGRLPDLANTGPIRKMLEKYCMVQFFCFHSCWHHWQSAHKLWFTLKLQKLHYELTISPQNSNKSINQNKIWKTIKLKWHNYNHKSIDDPKQLTHHERPKKPFGGYLDLQQSRVQPVAVYLKCLFFGLLPQPPHKRRPYRW